MLRPLILLLIFNLVALSTISAQTRPDERTDALRQIASKIASDNNNVAEVRMHLGDKRKGRISSVNGDSFSFTDLNSNASSTIKFADVDQIKKSGKGLSKGSWIAISAIAAGTIIVLVVTCPIYSWGCR